jgi:hypothetical protein
MTMQRPGFPSAAVACAGLLAGIAGCTPQGRAPATIGDGPAPGDYLGASVTALDDDLIAVQAQMRRVRQAGDIDGYTACVAARHARDTGDGFLRHVRTNIDEKGGIWRADAVYTISPTLPRGRMTIDAQVTAAECAENGVPTQ